MSGDLFNEAIEASYWIFDTSRAKGQAERDAFKVAIRRITMSELIDRVQSMLELRAESALDNESMAEHDLYQEAIELLHEAMRTEQRAREAGIAEAESSARDGVVENGGAP